jgi:hypothetical protein
MDGAAPQPPYPPGFGETPVTGWGLLFALGIVILSALIVWIWFLIERHMKAEPFAIAQEDAANEKH